MNTRQNDFDGNGIRVLTPTSCEVTEELNGAYEVVMEHPVDEYGAWKTIVENNILKVLGQLFMIYRVVTSFDENAGSVVAYARHIFYTLNEYWFHDLDWNAPDGQTLLDNLMKNSVELSPPGVNTYIFTAKSDIEAKGVSFSRSIDQQTLVNVIIGDKNSMVNAMGGELYRDNFYFSVNKRKEYASDDAFSIRVGFNLNGIERDVDFSNYMTDLTGYSESGKLRHSVSNWNKKIYPRHVARSTVFKMDEENQSVLNSMTEAYFKKYNTPDVTITVSVIDVSNNPDLKGVKWGDFTVGNIGEVYDERLGISLKMEVTGTKRNGITGEMISVTFNSIGFEYSRQDDFSKTVTDKVLHNAFHNFNTVLNNHLVESTGRYFMSLNEDGIPDDYTSAFTGEEIDNAIQILLDFEKEK